MRTPRNPTVKQMFMSVHFISLDFVFFFSLHLHCFTCSAISVYFYIQGISDSLPSFSFIPAHALSIALAFRSFGAIVAQKLCPAGVGRQCRG